MSKTSVRIVTTDNELGWLSQKKAFKAVIRGVARMSEDGLLVFISEKTAYRLPPTEPTAPRGDYRPAGPRWPAWYQPLYSAPRDWQPGYRTESGAVMPVTPEWLIRMNYRVELRVPMKRRAL